MSVVGVLYVVVGIIVAAVRGYLVEWNILGNLIEGLLAIILWPLVLFGLDLHPLIA
ncbi:hypothetical protein ACFSBZ_03010 [Amnibacterium flavum]|uniref:hypothetical protein n=1 Tax=Amnibacterium flavum TaxID=2173173 RepID=UPI0014035B0F|nr:hypothetical protein [Amnibacterium flavum]